MYILDLLAIDMFNKTAGGKGANLGEMLRSGLPVPPGFVLTTNAYEKFLEENELGEKIENLIQSLDENNPNSLKDASKDIENLIVNSTIPTDVKNEISSAYDQLSFGNDVKKMGDRVFDMIKTGRERVFVAVRSSATAEDLAEASFAGQMRTFLNISGLEKLLDAIKMCWASLYTQRAIYYRKDKKIENPLIAVIVQRMINSEKSGVMFTSHPATNDQSKIVIEGSWGLGEAVVSGAVTPDVYTVEKSTGNIIEKRISKKIVQVVKDDLGNTIKQKVPENKAEMQVLDIGELKKLWELAIRTETHYGKPQDMEWCFERGRVFLVQTRPITTLNKKVEVTEKPTGIVILSGLAASPGVAKGVVKIIRNLEDLKKIEKGDILVAKVTNPDFVPYMKKSAAIITNEGGLTSHAAIVSRELGTPCVVATRNATDVLKENQIITVDAINGKIYSGTIEIKTEAPKIPGMDTGNLLTATEIKANIAFPEAAEKAAGRVDGVGLLRAEHILTEQGKHPIHLAKTNPEELTQQIVKSVGQIAKIFYPKPVWYRSLDARTDEFQNLEGGEEEPKEANPMLGWHGIRRSLDETEILNCEIEALKKMHESGLDNIALMLPFVINVDELKHVKGMINFPIKLGIMVETPAAVLDIEDFCKEGMDFISIGSNDLTQLILGIDRSNTNISGLYSEMHPAVLKSIEHVVKICKKYGVKTSICGEGPSNIPALVEKLVGFGIDSISVEIDAIEKVKLIVARTERKLLLENIKDSAQ